MPSQILNPQGEGSAQLCSGSNFTKRSEPIQIHPYQSIILNQALQKTPAPGERLGGMPWCRRPLPLTPFSSSMGVSNRRTAIESSCSLDQLDWKADSWPRWRPAERHSLLLMEAEPFISTGHPHRCFRTYTSQRVRCPTSFGPAMLRMVPVVPASS
jgi:hypothetical protein